MAPKLPGGRDRPLTPAERQAAHREKRASAEAALRAALAVVETPSQPGGGVIKIIARRLPGEPETDLTGILDIQFGEGAAMITVSVRDGWVEVRTDSQLVIQPKTTNAVLVTGKHHSR